AALLDADNDNYLYVKRFRMEATKRQQNYIGDNPKSRLMLLTDTPYPRLEVELAPTTAIDGTLTQRPPIEIDAEEFISVKGFKAKGKRVTTLDTTGVKELEPTRFPDPEEEKPEEDTPEEEPENLDPDAGKSQQQVIDEMTGQLNIFTENADL
ncbi:MAG TPA: DNA gyrase/topoisomerase IV subunit A, partial [Prevotella sp.]|nr:DNA gyrase/topoisomerase IV subunit A [Prevotella sp.]